MTYHEVTGSAVRAAFARLRKIDMHLVRAQEGRRALDRLSLSSVVSSAVGVSHLSAGQVQSPTVCLIVDREIAIRDYKPVNHFGARLKLANGGAVEWKPDPWLP